MATPILYYWGPCTGCAPAVAFAQENGIELDKRDVEQQAPFDELTALGGDANKIPYLLDGEELICGTDEVIAYLKEHYL